MRKRRRQKPLGGLPTGCQRSGGCSTRRGENPRMTSFGLCGQRHGRGGWPGNGRRGGKRAGAAVFGKHTGM
jgi:hypothetical protein